MVTLAFGKQTKAAPTLLINNNTKKDTNTSNTNKKDGIFGGAHFFVELGVVTLQKKKELNLAIESNGGVIDFVISKKTTHVITHPEFLSSYKLKSGHAHGCFFVLEQFIIDSIHAGKRLDEWPYLFIGETPASEFGTGSHEFVGAQLAQAFANVSGVMDYAYTDTASSSIAEGVLNIASLCAGLGARIPAGNFPVNAIVNTLYNTVLKPNAKRVAPVPTQSPPQPPPPITPQKKVVTTPLFREIDPAPLSSRSSLSSATTKSSFSTSKFTTPSSSSLSLLKPPTPSSTFIAPTALKAPLKPFTFSSSSSSSPSSTTPSSPTAKTSPFSFPSKTPSSTTPAAVTSTVAAPSTSTSRLSIPPASKAVSYSYAQFEEERRKKREEEKAKRAEEGANVLKERDARRKEEEEARKKAMEDKKQELLERRKQEDEERKQKNKELIEAREQRIMEERKKRELAIEKLKQKPTHDLLTTAFFQQWDQEEGEKKMKEELEEQMKTMEAWKAKEEAKEKAAQERAERLRLEKERKALERGQQQKTAAEEKIAQKNQRREEYIKNKEEAALQKKREFEEKQAKLLEEYTKRQAKRERKALLGLHPELQLDYTDKKIFVGGIKMEDIKPDKKKLPADLVDRVSSERINSILRMFDAFGDIHQRRVFYKKGSAQAHCFITFKNKESVSKAVEGMKDAEERKKLVAAAKIEVEAKKLNALCVPHPSFYVRIPTEKKKKSAPKAGEEDGEESDNGGEWEEVPSSAPKPSSSAPKPSSSPSKPTVSISSPSAPTVSSPSAPTRRPPRPSIAPSPSSTPTSTYVAPTPAIAPTIRKPAAFRPIFLDPPKLDPIHVSNNLFCTLQNEDASDSESGTGSDSDTDSDFSTEN